MRGSLGNTRRSAASQGPKDQFVFRDEFDDGVIGPLWDVQNLINLSESGDSLNVVAGGTSNDKLATADTYAQVAGRIWEMRLLCQNSVGAELKFYAYNIQFPSWFDTGHTRLLGVFHTPPTTFYSYIPSANFATYVGYRGLPSEEVVIRLVETNPGCIVYIQGTSLDSAYNPGGTTWIPLGYTSGAMHGGAPVYIGSMSYTLVGSMDYIRCYDKNYALPTPEIDTASPSGPYTLTSPDGMIIAELTYAAGATAYIHIRRQDGSNYLRLGANAAGALVLDEVIGGTPANINTQAGAFSDGLSYQIEMFMCGQKVYGHSIVSGKATQKYTGALTEASFEEELGLDVSVSGGATIDKLIYLPPWNPPY